MSNDNRAITSDNFFKRKYFIDMPLQLKAQYDNQTALNDHVDVQGQIESDLESILSKINKIL